MNSPSAVRTEAVMGTLVKIQVLAADAEAAVDRAFGWFREIEARCSRFQPGSELMQLSARAGEAVTASAMVFEAVQFSLALAEETGGAFDPTVGRAMEERGYNREFRAGTPIHTPSARGASFRDVSLDRQRRTITLRRPLGLDLSAVAKGLAIDAAARELAPLRDFAIDAGGDLYLAGSNTHGEPWSVGIRHPTEDGLLATLRISGQAVCTSATNERGQHLLDARTGQPACSLVSATVVAPHAMLADALATAAFVLGPAEGIALLERAGVEGLLVTPDLAHHTTPGWRHAA